MASPCFFLSRWVPSLHRSASSTSLSSTRRSISSDTYMGFALLIIPREKVWIFSRCAEQKIGEPT
ncbi:unnamed protein product [Brassica oleracea]